MDFGSFLWVYHERNTFLYIFKPKRSFVEMELRHNTQQTIRVGVLLAKTHKFEDPMNPVYGALLEWYYWRYLIKPDGTVVDILNHTWSDIPNCAGCYFLTLTIQDTSLLGSLGLYLYDAASLGRPIFMNFNVIDKNVWDAKYGGSLLQVESHAQKG
jgi:hypothetical protein